MTTNRLLLTAREAADLYGISLRAFRDLCKADGFPAARSLGPRSVRWLLSELESYATALPAVRHDEPAQLTAARAAKAAGRQVAPAPFCQS